MSAFDVRFSPLQPKTNKETCKEEDVAVLTLTPFTAHPKISFENVLVGSSDSKALLIKNPNPRDVKLFLTKFPPFERCVSFSWLEQTIPAEDAVILEIIWSPRSEGGWHDVIILEDRCRLKKEVSITFKSTRGKTKKLGAKRRSTFPTKQKRSPLSKKSAFKRASPARARKKWSVSVAPQISHNFLNVPEGIRRETFCVGNKENAEPFHLHKPPEIFPGVLGRVNKRISVWSNASEFDDSLELESPLKNKTNLLNDSIFSPNIFSTTRKSGASFEFKSPNISSETYVKGNLSGSTYVINMEQSSFETYVKDDSIGNIAELEESSILTNQSRRETVDTIIKANLWSNRKSPSKNSNYKRKSTYKIPEINSKITKLNLHDISSETYVVGNTSSGTYVKDTSIGNIITWEESTPQIIKNPINSGTFSKKSVYKEYTTPQLIQKLPLIQITPSETNINSYGTYKRSPLAIPIRRSEHTKKLNFSKTLNLNKIVNSARKNFPTHNPDNFINGSELVTYTNNIDPFMTATLFFEPKWVDEQEKRFTKWLNMLLTPPDELNSNTNAPLVDVAKLWQQCKNRDVDKAPSKEEISNNFNSKALNKLRSDAKKFLQQPELTEPIFKVVNMIESSRLQIRKDKSIHLDIGIQHEIMGLFLCYNPLWLRIGFETVFGVTINLTSNTDIAGLAAFAMKHFFKDGYLLKKYKSVHSDKYVIEIKKHIMKKFLITTFFLDKAKVNRLIPYDPCLFCKKSPIKESREIIQRFSSAVIHAGGDINRHLGFSGYFLEYKQEYIHEFEYAVEILGSDLRDGVRLTKVMEIILLRNDLTKKLRVPANSRLQKIHNMKIVFESLSQANFSIYHDIEPKDIVDGHKEKTLSFLWQLIYKFQGPRFTKSVTTVQNWWRSLQIVIKRRILARKHEQKETAAKKIQAWLKRCQFSKKCNIFLELYQEHRRNYAATKIQSYVKMFLKRRKYRVARDLQISAITTLQSHTRGYLARKRSKKLKEAVSIIEDKYIAKKQMQKQLMLYQKTKNAVIFTENKYLANKLMCNERKKYLDLKSNTITIQRWFRDLQKRRNEKDTLLFYIIKMQRQFRAKMQMRQCFTEFNTMKHSATVIQRYYRAYKLRSEIKKHRRENLAAITIQKYFRNYLLIKQERIDLRMKETAATVIQRRFKEYLEMKRAREQFITQKNAVVTIQRRFRDYLLMKRDRQQFIEQKNAAMIIQTRFKAHLVMKQTKLEFDVKKNAAIKIQKYFRSHLLMKIEKTDFITKRNSAIIIQRRFREYLAMKEAREQFIAQKNAVIIIQRRFRANLLMKQEKLDFTLKKNALILIQRRFRDYLLMKRERQQFIAQKNAAIKIQKNFRSYLFRKKLRVGFINIQFYLPNIRAVEQFIAQRTAVVTIQRRFRAYLLMKQEKSNFTVKKNAVILIQRRFRDYLLMKRDRQQFIEQKNAAMIIQTRFKAHLLMKQTKLEFDVKKNAAIKIQKYFRSYLLLKMEKTDFITKKNAAIIIQKRFREYLAMKEAREQFIAQKNATVIIQRRFRGYFLMKQEKLNFTLKKNAVIIIQRRFRDYLLMKRERQQFIAQKNAAIKIQKYFRSYLLMKKARADFIILRKTALGIQRRFRDYLEMKAAEENAAIIIQTCLRAHMLMKKTKLEYIKKKKAATKIQNGFRSYLLMKKIKDDWRTKEEAAILIQRFFRQTMASREEEQQNSAARKIQNWYRNMKNVKRSAEHNKLISKSAVCIQRHYRDYKRIKENKLRKAEGVLVKVQACVRGFLVRLDYKEVLNNSEAVKLNRQQLIRKVSATKIQTAWRGYKARKESSSEVKNIRDRCRNAQKNADVKNTIAYIKNKAVSTLSSRAYINLMDYEKALKHLDYTVRRFKQDEMTFSPTFSKTIMSYILSPGRSFVHMEATKHATGILISLMKYPPTSHLAWFEDCVEDLIKKMVIFCDKENLVFPFLCTLFWLYCSKEEYLSYIKSISILEVQMRKIKNLCERKAKMISIGNYKAHYSLFGRYEDLPLPWLHPDWGLDLKDKPRTFTNSIHAYKAIFSILKLD